MDNAKATFDVLQNYFQDNKYQFSVVGARGVIETLLFGHNGIFNARIGVCEDPTIVSISILLPVVVPEARRTQAAETAVRANHDLLVGCFDMNMANGIVTFRASVPVADAIMTAEQFDATWHTALATTDRYHRAFCRLLYGDDLSPAEVVAEVEMGAK